MASLPKPLSAKTIQKMLCDWKPETVDTLHNYYAAFSNLYGVIMLGDAWKIFKKYETKYTKKEFMNFSDIARREELPYYILEIDELYCDEPRISNVQRFIVNKELVTYGYYRFLNVYNVIEHQADKPYFCPENMTQFSNSSDTEQWTHLCDFIRNIKTDNGQKLSEYIHLSESDKFDLDYYKSQHIKDEILKRADIPASERIINTLHFKIHIGENPFSYLSHLFEESNALLTEKQLEKLMQLLQNANNHSHQWANCGWTPIELRRKYGNPAPRSISFGAGLQKAFENGDIDKEELMKQIQAMGFFIDN